MRIAVCSRTYGGELYEFCKEFISLPYDMVPFTGIGSRQYVESILLLDKYDIVVNIDEDCFVYDNKEITNLIDHMVENGYDYAGVPDGGVIPIRKGSPIAMNPFFNVFDLRKIRGELLNYGTGKRRTVEFKDKTLLEKVNVKLRHKSFSPITREPYYPCFYWLAINFRPLYLDAVTHKDRFTSIVKSYNGKPICYHAWLARYYHSNKMYNGVNHRKRINNLVKELRILRSHA